MDRYKRYGGIFLFSLTVLLALVGMYFLISPQIDSLMSKEETLEKKQAKLASMNNEKNIVDGKLKKLQTSLATSQKKVFSPVESDLGDDTLFFTMYKDLLDMIRSNAVKIKSIDTTYNPKDDIFVLSGNGEYFVCDVKMELVANYVNLGKVIEDLYQYPYYLKMVDLNVQPHMKDKKVLLANLTLRLYAHTDHES